MIVLINFGLVGVAYDLINFSKIDFDRTRGLRVAISLIMAVSFT
jgi:hypothetical protein